MTHRLCRARGVLALLLVFAAPSAFADPAARDAAVKRLQDAASGTAKISPHKATGANRFVRLPPAARGLGQPAATTAREKQEQSAAFFRNYGAAVGVTDPAGLRYAEATTDRAGGTHLTFRQFHGGVPVFAGTVKTHFDASHRLASVNGTAVPDLAVSTTPSVSGAQAAELALDSVKRARGNPSGVGIGKTTLYVYREGLAKGVPGEAQLAWEVEVTNRGNVRDLVYVGAHTGKVIETVNGIHDALYRRAYDGRDLAIVPPNYPNGAYWLEGQRFPTASVEANNMITGSKEMYDLFKNAFGRDSWDGNGAIMDAIFDRGYGCPNASWNGTFISFCPGFTTDDVTAHEWGHAYTERTHGLIYEWQPGALNESYSDIWGEVVDLVNGRGVDTPGNPRTAAACSTFSPPVGTLRVNTPADLARDYFAQSAQFGPPLTQTGITGAVVAALDAANAAGPSTLDGCTTITNGAAVSGNIALVDRGGCEFSTKVLNAQNAGAIAVIVANNAPSGLPGMGAGAVAAQVTIPSLGVEQATGNAIRASTNPVNATLLARPGTDASYAWLMGEEITDGGALRDMWNPTCYSNPGKVSDAAFYVCDASDGGGVHTNSGIPNHAFALLVDGGTYNGQTVASIGLTKAAHIYFQASLHQVQDSDFADHADALEQACTELMAAPEPLPGLTAGGASAVITSADCAEVTKAIAAVELRSPPPCTFATILNPALPALCSAATTSGGPTMIASFDFEGGAQGFTATHAAGSALFTPRDWALTNELPPGRAGGGSAFFAPDRASSCTDGSNETGVLHLTSPAITLPSNTAFARATFTHWFGAEPGWDGGTLNVSVNGGPFQFVPPSEITFNNYIAFLFTAADGNTNPLAGLPAWTGTTPGSVSDGSWGRTHVNLRNFARAGDSVRLRWSFGTDVCAGRTGWYVDDVSVFSCTPNVPVLTVADISLAEGNAGTKFATFTVRASVPTILPVRVAYAIADGTATHGNDFETNVAGVLTIPAGATSGTIAVSVKGDIVPEGDETFTLQLGTAQNATVGDGQAVATITDDDGAPPGQSR